MSQPDKCTVRKMKKIETLLLCLKRLDCPKDVKSMLLDQCVTICEQRFRNGAFRSFHCDLLGGSQAYQKVWHRNGQLASVEWFKDGKLHGPSWSYYRSGAKKSACEWTNGDTLGISIDWYRDGQMKQYVDLDTAKGWNADGTLAWDES